MYLLISLFELIQGSVTGENASLLAFRSSHIWDLVFRCLFLFVFSSYLCYRHINLSRCGTSPLSKIHWDFTVVMYISLLKIKIKLIICSFLFDHSLLAKWQVLWVSKWQEFYFCKRKWSFNLLLQNENVLISIIRIAAM